MRVRRVRITLEVNCDPIPGSFHELGDWVEHFADHCNQGFPWYEPAIVAFEDIGLVERGASQDYQDKEG